MTTARPHERGQMLALFAICLVAIIAMTGLVIDGGLTMVQRRDQQNVADAAAMAGAYAYANTNNASSAVAQAQSNAAANGYANGTDNVVVTADVAVNNGLATVTTRVTKPHRNFFSGIIGFGSWDVSTTASAIAGTPNAVVGAMPLLFNKKAFPDGHGPHEGAGVRRARVRERRRAPGRDSPSTGPSTARPTATDKVQRRLEHGQGPDRPQGRVDRGLARRRHRPAQRRLPHDAVQRAGRIGLARSSRSRSSTTTASSWAGRCST